MTNPAPPAGPGDLEPGWSHDEPSPFGPCYKRHAPGKGMIRAVDHGRRGYAWFLSTASRPESLSEARGPFARPRDAMRDADRQVPLLPQRMFEDLTPADTRELYRKLSRACDWGRDTREPDLDEVLGELFRQMTIQATDPGYHGPAPHTFIHAVREASRGAALQAMSASPNKASWLAMTPHRRAERLAATEYPGPPAAGAAAQRPRPGCQPAAARPGPLRSMR